MESSSSRNSSLRSWGDFYREFLVWREDNDQCTQALELSALGALRSVFVSLGILITTRR